MDGLQLTAGKLTDASQYGISSQCSTVTYKNTGTGSASYNPFDWQLSLVPGGHTEDAVCFSTEASKGEYRVIYSPFGGTHASWTTTR